ncbi:MAG: ABC transporter ATP-binding protein [Alphaproteobacteria bacterium]|nr:ABC transporter ATP-binding protein [Alphaproteobacteria bacterium]
MLKVENLKKQYVSFEGGPGGGVLGVSFEIVQGELFTLLGPSGCGKTTTLRAVAGLEVPDTGRISLGGTVLFDGEAATNVPMYDRDIGMVFQSYAIWPHMSVFENAAYPLRVSRTRKLSAREIETKTMATLDMVGLSEFAKRPSTQLSGGQQQRLALARAFTREPSLLLLDEPLSNLDAQLREQMRIELKRLQRETGVTAIYVTHDQAEALAISDRIAVMNQGRIVQIGAPKEIYGRPSSEFVANFIGRTNLLKGTVVGDVAAEAVATVKTALGMLDGFFSAARRAGQAAALVVRPEHIAIISRGTAGDVEGPANRLSGRVTRETYLGEIVEYLVAVSGGEILVRTSSTSDISNGDSVSLIFPAERTIALLEA